VLKSHLIICWPDNTRLVCCLAIVPSNPGEQPSTTTSPNSLCICDAFSGFLHLCLLICDSWNFHSSPNMIYRLFVPTPTAPPPACLGQKVSVVVL